MSEPAFDAKWSSINEEDKGRDNTEEKSIFVDVGNMPQTQRQFNLFHYFEWIKHELLAHKAHDVLEIGCGRGTIGLYMRKHMGLKVSLLDNVESAIVLAKAEFKQHNLDAEFFVEDVLKTHFPDNSFDAVVSIGLAEHFEGHEIEALLKEQYRILRPNGVMVSLNIPKKFSIQYLNIVMRTVKKLLGTYHGDVRKDYFRNSLTPKNYEVLAKGAGFKDVYTMRTFPFPFFIPIRMTTDRALTKFFLFIVRLRRIFQKYPYKTNALFAQSHFLVGTK